jgi:hypothetical protein
MFDWRLLIEIEERYEIRSSVGDIAYGEDLRQAQAACYQLLRDARTMATVCTVYDLQADEVIFSGKNLDSFPKS